MKVMGNSKAIGLGLGNRPILSGRGLYEPTLNRMNLALGLNRVVIFVLGIGVSFFSGYD